MPRQPRASPSSSTANEATLRTRNLVAQDAANVMARLEARHVEMFALFSRLRERAPLLEPLKSWFPTITVRELGLLDVAQLTAVNAFYEELESLRWYFQYTVDMPGTTELVFHRHHHRLKEAHATLAAALAPPAPGTKARAVRARAPKPRGPKKPPPSRTRAGKRTTPAPTSRR